MAGRPRWSKARVAGLVAVGVLVVAGLAVVVGEEQSGWSSGGGGDRTSAVTPAYPDAMVPPAPAGEAARGAAGDPSAAAAPGQGGGPVRGVPVGGLTRALVRTAQLTVEVDDAAASARQVRTAAATAGAVVSEEQSSDTGAWIVLRVPVDALDRLVDDVAAFGRVTDRSSRSVDATEEVVDLDARVASQQASVARVRALLAQAESIGDIVEVESELARREAELDSLTSRLAALREQVALSTLTVELRGPATPGTVGDDRADGFLGGLATGWAGLLAMGSALAEVLGVVLPFLPVVALLAGIAWLVRRMVRARRVPAVAGAGGRSGPGPEGGS